jgi:hypothetical protein
MSENKEPLIPTTGNANPPQQVENQTPPVELLLLQIGDHQRAIGDLSTKLYNEVILRDQYIKSLPKPN